MFGKLTVPRFCSSARHANYLSKPTMQMKLCNCICVFLAFSYANGIRDLQQLHVVEHREQIGDIPYPITALRWLTLAKDFYPVLVGISKHLLQQLLFFISI